MPCRPAISVDMASSRMAGLRNEFGIFYEVEETCSSGECARMKALPGQGKRLGRCVIPRSAPRHRRHGVDVTAGARRALRASWTWLSNFTGSFTNSSTGVTMRATWRGLPMPALHGVTRRGALG